MMELALIVGVLMMAGLLYFWFLKAVIIIFLVGIVASFLVMIVVGRISDPYPTDNNELWQFFIILIAVGLPVISLLFCH